MPAAKLAQCPACLAVAGHACIDDEAALLAHVALAKAAVAAWLAEAGVAALCAQVVVAQVVVVALLADAASLAHIAVVAVAALLAGVGLPAAFVGPGPLQIPPCLERSWYWCPAP